MSTDKIVIVALPNYWNKTRLTVGIVDTRATNLVSARQYHDLAIESIEIWQKTLNRFGTENNEFSNLAEIVLDVSEIVTGNEDIIVGWWFANPSNGRTQFEPVMGRIGRAQVFIAKCHGPDIPNMDNFSEQIHGVPRIRTPEQIRSVILHEFGHVLGVGHCDYYKDMMATG
ncbi:MAG: matrixin family metalloprotease, partial [Nitrosotalea sp.]